MLVSSARIAIPNSHPSSNLHGIVHHSFCYDVIVATLFPRPPHSMGWLCLGLEEF